MDIIVSLNNLPREKEKLIYRKVIGKTKTWVYPINALSPASRVHCSANPRENEPGYQGFRGYGGSTLTFILEDGSQERMTGPWHTTAEALYEDTGVDIRNQYLTYVIVAKKRKLDEKYRTIYEDVVYQDKKPKIGKFHRGNFIAMKLAKKLKRKLYLFRQSMGGAMDSPVYPDQADVYGKRKALKGLSAEQSDIVCS